MREFFRKFSHRVADLVGSPGAFVLALCVIIVWGITGPIFQYSDTWQLVINTATTIITFLMVFLIQNAQNRDSKAVNLKLDELIKCNETARNSLVDLENLSDAELEKLAEEFKRFHIEMGEKLEDIHEAKAKRSKKKR